MTLRIAATALVLTGIALAGETGNPNVTGLLNTFSTNCGVPGDRYRKAQWVFAERNESGKWRKMSMGALKACEACSHTAYVWKGHQGRLLVEFNEVDESGDWYQYVMYCFQSNGTLEQAISDLNTAWGWAVVQEFTVQGDKVVAHAVEYRNLRTWEKTSKPKDPIDADEFYGDRKPRMYSRAGSLPFYSLLERH